MYSPSQFGKLINRSVNTLQRWDREGIVKAKRNQKNRRYYTHDQYLEYLGVKSSSESLIVVYIRVSSVGQKNDMQSQKAALEQYCIAKGYNVHEYIEEIGSGLNYKRKRFNQLMQDIEMGKICKLVVAHKDRLVRFGFEWFESFSQRHGCKIEVMNVESLSPEAEMTKDLLSIIHCFSSRLYGLRKYKKNVKAIILGQEILQ